LLIGLRLRVASEAAAQAVLERTAGTIDEQDFRAFRRPNVKRE
jgi:hypothetical protein